MKKIILVFLFLSVLINVNAQQKAVTETGDEVILFEDGTWSYQNPNKQAEESVVQTNPKIFKKDSDASFLLKSNKVDYGFWINPKVWSFKKAVDNKEAEYQLYRKKGDLYGMIITEKIEIPIETLKSIAFQNGQKAAPDLKIIKEEYRIVNGQKVVFLQMDGTIQGVKFSYYGYYFSNINGTVQFITYTSQNLLADFKEECDKLLNGLVILTHE